MRNTRAGRWCWVALLSGTACQSSKSETSTSTKTPLPVATVASLPEAPDSVRTLAVPVQYPEQLELLAVGDSIGPRVLDVSLVGTAQLRAELADEDTEADTVAGRFLIIKPFDTPRLLYRAHATDTVWTEMDGLFDHYEHGGEQQRVEVRQANLDGQGRPEALITFHSASYGSGGGVNYTSHYLLDVTSSSPRLLLQASTEYVLESFPAYAAMHGTEVDENFEQFEGFEREVTLRRRELRVGPIEPSGQQPELSWSSYLTQLPAGRYHYQRGRVYRVRQDKR